MAASIKDRVTVVEGDITKQRVDAIVNAANNSLLGGGGVDGAIHRAAGRELTEECRKIGGCPTGEARITGGYNLPAQWVIHTVGPVWNGGQNNEETLLSNCYRNSFALAKEYNAQSIAFPSISTGAYGYPIAHASRIAVTQTHNFLLRSDVPAEVIFVCHSRPDYDVYVKAVQDWL